MTTVSLRDIGGNYYSFEDAEVSLLTQSGVLTVRDKNKVLYNFILHNLVYYTVQNDHNKKIKEVDEHGDSSQMP